MLQASAPIEYLRRANTIGRILETQLAGDGAVPKLFFGHLSDVQKELISALRVAEHAPPSFSDHLDGLRRLVGDFVDLSGKQKVGPVPSRDLGRQIAKLIQKNTTILIEQLEASAGV